MTRPEGTPQPAEPEEYAKAKATVGDQTLKQIDADQAGRMREEYAKQQATALEQELIALDLRLDQMRSQASDQKADIDTQAERQKSQVDQAVKDEEQRRERIVTKLNALG